jgi:cellobiose phosphorylase
MQANRQDSSLYYRFDDERREVVMLRPDCPSPWMNYLSNGEFHTMMSQAGGALAWYRSPQIWRINRYRFFHLPMDRSGMYVYLRDADSGRVWCPTGEPMKQKPARWQARHGLGYTRFEAEQDGLGAELCYFIGPHENTLIWNLKLTNRRTMRARLDIFAFVEFGMMEFLREVSWICYMKHQMRVDFASDDAALIFDYAVESQPKPGETPLVYLAADRPLVGFDGDRDEFIGCYRSESDPFVLENGDCTGSTMSGGDPCGALQARFELEPDATETVNFFLGTSPSRATISKTLRRTRASGFVEKSFASLTESWRRHTNKYQCRVPDVAAQRQINIWNPYQAQRNFQFSRNISFYATGTFRGVGFRDTAQDIIAQSPFDQPACRAKLRLLLGQQYADGHVNHYFFPVEGYAPVNRLHSDNHLWPVLSVWALVMEEGNAEFLHESVPYYDGGTATIYEHLAKSVAFTKTKIGEHGFPLMLHSDWNDALFKVAREGRGESIWTAMQLGVCLKKLIELARLAERHEDIPVYEQLYGEQRQLVETLGWDGGWYRRAIMDDGNFLGTKVHDEAQLWLNAQSWAVISGYADPARAVTAMDAVRARLDTDLGIKLIDPPIVNFPDPENPLTHYNKGTGENAAIFCHANCWAVLTECLLGRGDVAWKYYRQLIPEVAMAKAGAWRYKGEPYVYASNIFGPDSDKFGLANVTWLSGTAAWMYIAVSQYLLGVRPQWDGLLVDPCLPADWTEAQVTREFRGTVYRINISKPAGLCRGRVRLSIGEAAIDGNVIPPQPTQEMVEVRAEISNPR